MSIRSSGSPTVLGAVLLPVARKQVSSLNRARANAERVESEAALGGFTFSANRANLVILEDRGV